VTRAEKTSFVILLHLASAGSTRAYGPVCSKDVRREIKVGTDEAAVGRSCFTKKKKK
jgi:hypothetical protein